MQPAVMFTVFCPQHSTFMLGLVSCRAIAQAVVSVGVLALLMAVFLLEVVYLFSHSFICIK